MKRPLGPWPITTPNYSTLVVRKRYIEPVPDVILRYTLLYTLGQLASVLRAMHNTQVLQLKTGSFDLNIMPRPGLG